MPDKYRHYTEKKNYRRTASNPLPGFYRGKVEFINDPLKLGRVKIRIPSLHGIWKEGDEDGTFLKTANLPWAVVCQPHEAGFDYGTFVVPEVGTVVYIGFEAGDPNKPIVFGAIYSKGKSESKYNKITRIPETSKLFTTNEGKWNAAGGEEVPKDAFQGNDTNEPTRRVYFKTPKGHTIYVEEADGVEHFSIIDRVGQIFKFICPVTQEKNENNREQRGTDNSIDSKPKDNEQVSVGKKAVIIIKDIAGQFLRFVGKFQQDKVELVSKNNDFFGDAPFKRDSVVVLKSKDGDTGFTVATEKRNNDDGNRVVIRASADDSTLELEIAKDKEILSRIKMYPEGIQIFTVGLLEITANNGIAINSMKDITCYGDEKFKLNIDEGIYIDSLKEIKIHTDDIFELVADEGITLESKKNIGIYSDAILEFIADGGISLDSLLKIEIHTSTAFELVADTGYEFHTLGRGDLKAAPLHWNSAMIQLLSGLAGASLVESDLAIGDLTEEYEKENSPDEWKDDKDEVIE